MKPDVTIAPMRHIVDLDPVRKFSRRLRLKIFHRANGHCELCGIRVRGRWIAGHIIPHSVGGRTTIENGRVECLACARKTHADDTDAAARCKRREGKTGQYARRKKNGPQLKSRGFNRSLSKKFDGSVVKR